MEPPSYTKEKDPAEELFAWFRTMLNTAPVYRDPEQGWQLFGYADIARILAETSIFSSDTARVFNPPQPDLDFFDMGNLVTTDPPRHRQLRSLISSVFTARAVAGLTPRIERVTSSLLDTVDGADRFDLIDSLAYALPITVIAELLGLPMADEPRFRVWGDALGTVDAATVPPDQLANEVAPAVREMNEYLMDHVRHRRRNPGDDIISRLATAEIDGKPVAEGEIVGLIGLTMFAGHATTMALIGNAALLLFDHHPAAGNAVRADRTLLPGVVEEVMRLRPPFPRLARITTADTEIGGHTVPAGELVTPWIGAANRDATRFPDPDRFDIHRTGSHLVFGQGIHFCLGAPLARLEGRIALGILMDRYQHIAVDQTGELEFENPRQIISPRRLPIWVSR